MKIVDLFAGIGGIRLGFEQAFGAIDCVLTSEIDKFAVQTYQANFVDHEPVAGDITQINEWTVPHHDILLAGFPCQPFSQAGLKKGFSDTRGTLFFDIERILEACHPAVFLLENVKQLKGHDQGRTIRVILEHLSNLGYELHVQILNARDFGVPQNRERIFIVGFLEHGLGFSFPTPTRHVTKVGDILEDQVDPKYTLSDKLWHGHQRRKIENKLKGKGFGYNLLHHDALYTNTISARYYKDGSEILIAQTHTNPRKLTPREAARLQGFPENFVLPVSDVQAYKQLGNSVCVNVVKAIATNIKNALEQKQDTVPTHTQFPFNIQHSNYITHTI